MDTPLDDIAFLANSENRVAIFAAIAERPRHRDDIRAEVDASRVTIARILREFEARDWIAHSGTEYAVTPLGEWVCDEFTRLVGEMESEHRLRGPLQWIPDDVVTFDARCLRDAEIIMLDGSDATRLIRRIVEFHRSGDDIRGIARESAPEAIENQWEVTVNGDTRVELVITPEILRSIRDHRPSARRFREMLAAENAHYFVSEEIPISVGIVDDAVGINLADEHGTLKGGLKTENETVHAWAVDLFETCRDEASPVESDVITV